MALQGRITIYSITGCPHCKAAKTKLQSLDLPFFDINLDEHPKQRDIMTKITGRRTVPQIFFNDKHVGGNDDFQSLSEDELQELIQYVANTPVSDSAPKLPKRSSTSFFVETNMSQEEDDLSKLIKLFKETSGDISTHRKFLIFSVSNSFTGKDIINFVAEKKSIDIKSATELSQEFMKKKLVLSVDGAESLKYDGTLYRLVEDLPEKALNAGTPYYADVAEASGLAVSLRKSILKLYGTYLSENGKSVDYKGIAESDEFKEYVQLTLQLQRLSLDNLTREQLLAFFINIYNALVIHGNVQYGFPESAFQRYKFFNYTRYIIGGYAYSLQDVENGVLRNNRKGIGMLSKPFSKADPRIKFIVSPHEPLIHFALVCGAKSCPPIKTYSQKHVMKELTLAAESFLESDDGCQVDKEKNEVKLSRIFKWYIEDFGSTNSSLLNWIHDHMPESTKKNDLTEMLKNESYKLSFMHYDWGSNTK